MRRLLLGLVLLVAVLIALPPLWFAIFPAEAFELPPPGRRVGVANGLTLNVLERGSGPPVVLVHGLPGSAYDWSPLTEALGTRGLRVLAYDRLGYGHSDSRSEDDFSIQANARDLLALLENEDLRDVSVVGWSYGGPVSLIAAKRDPSRIGRIVLVGSGGPSGQEDEPPDEFAGLIFSAPALAWMKAVPPVARGLRAALSVQAFSEQPQPDWWMPQLNANLDQPHTLQTWKREIEGIFDSAQEDLGLEVLQRPLLLLHGDDDRLAPVAIGRHLHSQAPGSELVIVEAGSHMLPVTHSELLADQIAAFAGRSTSRRPQAGP